MRSLAVLGLAAVCCGTIQSPSGSAEPKPTVHAAAAEPQRLTPSARVVPQELRALEVVGSRGVVPQGGAKYVVHNIELADAATCAKFDVKDVWVFNRFDRFADAYIAADNDFKLNRTLAAVQAAKGYVWDEFAGSADAPPPRVGQPGVSRATPEAIVRGGLAGLTGKGVIIVIVDTGLDFHNQDFVTLDAKGQPVSRLRYFWDTTCESWAAGEIGAATPVTYPNGISIGRLYSRDDLNRDLRSPRPLIPVWDIDGHGTACAGVAAGNGKSSDGRYVGVAPEAEIIGVRLGDQLEHSYLLSAICGWVDRVAGDMPVVFSCSFGLKDGGRDGMRICDRQLSTRFPLTRTGRAICIAAGNDGGSKEHAEVSFGDLKHAATLRWSLPTGGFLTVYYNSSDRSDLRYLPGGGRYLGETGSINKVTGQYVSYFAPPAGKGELKLYSKSGKTITADAYLSSDGDARFGFDASCAAASKLIQSPGSAVNAITVGSYDWNDQFDRHGKLSAFTDPLHDAPLTIGALSGYSSVGPLRNNSAVKPDIVAPGQYFAASAARNTRAVYDTTGRYMLFNGTSAATPYTAGVVALVMQRKPKITLGEIKELLKTCAKQDRFTGPVPNAKWGHGKLNLQAIEAMLDRVK